MTPADCPFCLNAHTDWTTGEVWQCQRCYFRIPAKHVWFSNVQEDAEPDANTHEYEQLELGLETL